MIEKIDAALVILYHPDASVFQNIKTYIHSVNKLYIVDNSDKPHSLIDELLDNKNIEILHTGSNIGIAKALNLTLDHASTEGIDWLMTFDQDSSFEASDLKQFLKDFHTLNDKKLALVSPLHNKKFIKETTETVFSEVDYVMTSGNIVNVSIAKSIGGFDEKLFIDEVDHAFCFLLTKYHYRILCNTTIALQHTLGTKDDIHKNITLYEPTRLYYMMRNYLYLKKQYADDHPSFFNARNRYLWSFFKDQLRYGKSPFKNLKMIFRGILDYKRQQFGKLNNES